MAATKDLIGAALDWAIGTANGGLYQPASARGAFWIWPGEPVKYSKAPPAYSTDWSQGGPIIERENISVGYQGHLGVPLDSLWYATNRSDACGFGQTPLIAALRCFVASKLGPNVEVPEELAP